MRAIESHPMSNLSKPSNPVFFVALSHRDLSFYLSVNTQKRAANDQDFCHRASVSHVGAENNVLSFANAVPAPSSPEDDSVGLVR